MAAAEVLTGFTGRGNFELKVTIGAGTSRVEKGAVPAKAITWCRLRDAVRVFRLDRITMIEVTGEPAPERRPAALDDGCLPARTWHPNLVA